MMAMHREMAALAAQGGIPTFRGGYSSTILPFGNRAQAPDSVAV